MAKRMLIDATHHEETRVVVLDGNKLTEFDYESQFRRQLKGNIFLAKVTRVEPSLQAAFVNFGGNRHGFLPFAEIHPDYYRIPVADREALLAEQQAMEEAARAAEDADDTDDDEGDQPSFNSENSSGEDESLDESDTSSTDQQGVMSADLVADETGYVHEEVTLDAPPTRAPRTRAARAALPDSLQSDTIEPNTFQSDDSREPTLGHEQSFDTDEQQPTEEDFDPEQLGSSESNIEGDDVSIDPQETSGQNNHTHDQPASQGRRGWRRGNGGRYGRSGPNGGSYNGQTGGRHGGSRPKRDDTSEEGPMGLHARFRRKYKIQEVIKRGQIMLIQVSKEERGNKGAAVTTYLSLPGRYCVLMPNSPRGGGVSRKIDNFADRRRLKSMLRALEIPSGMSVILRTAGVERTETEIKRDYDYLLRLWNNIRELTLQSTAPASIYEEGDLIKRSIRDIYTDDIEDITVSGERGFKEARDFMGMLMPSHIDQVVEYKNDKIPLFQRYQVEGQINCIGEPVVQLKSGGYIVINQTEALVAVDVNSGRSTRERHIEETALKTNLEAAEEVARQLRLRDLGGLVVIDFIDMEDRRNNMKVERRLKDALSTDRARIQVSRISNFGLLELSRQRLNPSLTEAQFQKCPHCEGFGYIRSVDSAAIMALRSLEEEGVRARTARVALHIPNAIALYILNSKRDMLAAIEQRYAFKVMMNVDESLAPSGFRVEALREAIVADDIDSSDDTTEASQNDASSPPRTPRRNKKPVFMEQALEPIAPSDDIEAIDLDTVNDDMTEGAENFNRQDVEPDSDLDRIPGPTRGPRRHHLAKSAGQRDGGRHQGRDGGRSPRGRDRTPRDQTGGGQYERVAEGSAPIGEAFIDQKNSTAPRGDRGDQNNPRNNNRGPRRNNNRGASKDLGAGNRGPRRDYAGGGSAPEFEGQNTPRPSRQDVQDNQAVVTPRPTGEQKSGATYFVAKRRPSQDNMSEQSGINTTGAGTSTASSTISTPQTAPTSTDSSSGDPSGPKKKGWWSKFS